MHSWTISGFPAGGGRVRRRLGSYAVSPPSRLVSLAIPLALGHCAVRVLLSPARPVLLGQDTRRSPVVRLWAVSVAARPIPNMGKTESEPDSH